MNLQQRKSELIAEYKRLTSYKEYQIERRTVSKKLEIINRLLRNE